MRLVALTALSFNVALVFAFRTNLQRVPLTSLSSRTRSPSTDLNTRADDVVTLTDDKNIVYMANISVGGTAYTVQLDTGSSDLWIKSPSGSLPSATSTSLTYNISYSIGYAAGNIVKAPVTFAGITIPDQAVLDVTASNNPILNYGAVGILGLGFNSLSFVYNTVTNAGQTWGNPFLYNAFAQNASQPNFMAFQLERHNGLPSDQPSVLGVGEVESPYSGITQTTMISTYPVSQPSRWTVLLDGYEYADGVKRTMNSTVQGAPSALLLLDTGASYAYAPTTVVTGLYGSIPGASWNSTKGMWDVPCNQEVNFALWIAGRKFDWHPLDVTVQYLADPSTCVGSIMPDDSLDGFDFHGGDVFLRNLYTLLDFGDTTSTGEMGNPYVRLWSLIDQPTASSEFIQLRGGTPQAYSSSSTANPNAAVSDPDAPTGGVANAANGTTTITANQQLISNMNTLTTYAPIALGILALNAILLLGICFMGICYMCRRRRSKKKGVATGAGLTVPSLGNLSRSHSYKQVRGEDIETPLDQLDFDNLPPPRERKGSHGSSYGLQSPDDGDVTVVGETLRMSTFTKAGSIRGSQILSPVKANNFRHAPSGLGQSMVVPDVPPLGSPGTPAANLPSAPGSRSHSPAASPARPNADLPEAMSDTQHTHSNSDGSQQGPSGRTEEYLAAMEARKAALGVGGDGRRNTYQSNDAGQPLQPPQRGFAGESGRRALSTYGSGAQPDPLSVPPRRPNAPTPDSGSSLSIYVSQPGEHVDAVPENPAEAARSHQEYLATLEARRNTMLGSGQPGDGERTTMYFDAPEGSPGSPGATSVSTHSRAGSFAAAQSVRHGRSGSNASSANNRSPLSSPNRPSFQPQTPPRGMSNLNPAASNTTANFPPRAVGPSMSGPGSGHGRSGSYAGPGTTAPRQQTWNRSRSNLAEEADLTEQRPSLDERAEDEQHHLDGFADGRPVPPKPFANQGYRYSSMQ